MIVKTEVSLNFFDGDCSGDDSGDGSVDGGCFC